MAAPTVEHSAAKGGQGGGDGTNPWVLPNVQVTAGNKLLIFVSALRLSKTVTTVTRNGQSATLVTGSTANADNGSIRVNGAWYFIDNPTVGTFDVSVAYTGTDTAGWVISAQTLVGAASGQPHAVAQNAAISSTPVAPTITTSVVDTLVLSGFMVGRSDTVTGVAADSPATTLSSPISTDTSATHAQKGKIASAAAATATGYTVTHTLTGTPNRTAQSLVAVAGSVSGVSVSGSGALSLAGTGTVNVGVAITGLASLLLHAAGALNVGVDVTGGGVLGLGASGAIAVAVDVAGGGSLPLNASGAITVPVAIAGGGALPLNASGTVAIDVAVSGGGALPLAGAGTVSIPIAIAGGGTLTLGAAGTIAIAVDVQGGGSLPINATGEVIVGALPAILAGGGSLTLWGVGTVTIAIDVSGGGALPLGASGAVAVPIAIGGGGALGLNGAGVVRIGVRLAGGGSLPLAAAGTIVVGGAVIEPTVIPSQRGIVILGQPQGLEILGQPQGLVILDEGGNVGTYAIKVGDDDPPLEFGLTGTDGAPFDASGLTVLEVGFRRSGESEYALVKDLATGVEVFGTDNDRVRVTWEIGETELLGEGDIEFEAQGSITGERMTTFPGGGYGTFVIWGDIVPDPAS